MTKATRALALSLGAALLWAALFSARTWAPHAARAAPVLAPLASASVLAAVDDIAPALPFWALVTFGAYALGSIGWALWTFGDCPDAYEELMREIKLAKKDLKTKCVDVGI